MKRVYCLYRVSTTQQVDVTKDDIPMQRIACRQFAEKMGWSIIVEKEEKGISGFKVSAGKRDAIQELKEAALNGEFDILLVFMFDRLGRIENETPFVLEWFAQHGIEVWSVNEGQQRFEQHVDKLMNYIRFWQASGESEKTSIRVKTRMQQMVSEGIYTGGPVPFGFMLVSKGRLNKKGQEMRDLAVCPEEQIAVEKIHDLVIEEGYGTHRLATWLNDRGYTTKTGGKFTAAYVLRILKNPLNRGVISKGGVSSEPIAELRLVSDYKHFKVLEILEQRNGKNEEKRTIAMTNRGQALLPGIICCAHCGCRLATSRVKVERKGEDGNVHIQSKGRYICYHRSRGLNDCDGMSVYDSERIDKAVMRAMEQIFSSITGCPEEEKIQAAQKRIILEYSINKKKLELEIEQNTKKLETLRAEIAKAIVGDSLYTQEDLATAIQALKGKIEMTRADLESMEKDTVEKRARIDAVIPAYKQFRSWSVEFYESSLEVKKMIASQLFSRITVNRNYELNIELNFTYRQFCEEWLSQEQSIKETA